MQESSSKVTEVVFSDSSYAILMRSSLNKNPIIRIKNNICIGDISTLGPIGEKLKTPKVRIWTSHNNTYEYLNMLYLCSNLSNEISVVFIDEYDENCYSLGCAKIEELKSILKMERTLTKEEIIEYRKIWDQLQKENSELRVIVENTIKSVDFDALTPYIINNMTSNEIKIKRLVGRLLVGGINNNFPDDIWMFLIKRLIDIGIISITIHNANFFENTVKLNEKVGEVWTQKELGNL